MQAGLASVARNAIYSIPHCNSMSVFTHQLTQLCNLRFNVLPSRACASASPSLAMCPGQLGDQKTSLEYRPLGDLEIRLVSFKRDQGGSSPFELQLEHFECLKAPSYIALSYVWGNPDNSHPVNVNSRDFNVTRNLYEALLHIYELSSIFEEGLSRQSESGHADLFLWVDALCINQRDIDEKSKQVPRMTEIFSSAYTVLIWLGSFDKLGRKILGIELLLHVLESMSPLDEFPKPTLTFVLSPEPRDPGDAAIRLLETYMEIMRNDWFRRGWVVQEYALSRQKPCALLGNALFSFQSLNPLGSVLSQLLLERQGDLLKDWADSLGLNPEILNQFAFGPTCMRDMIASREFQEKSLAYQLLSIIMNQCPKLTAVPHDKIYGLLGMVNLAQLPAQLTPNYRLSYGQVSKDYTRFIIEDTKDLRILMFLGEALDGQPSWVNGFHLDTPWHIEPAVRHTGFFSSNGESLVVEGIRCGKILSFFSGGKDMTGARMQQFYDTILSTAAEIRQQPLSDTWEEWFGEFVDYVCRVPGDHANRYRSVSDFLANALPGYSNGPSEDSGGSYALKLFSLCEFALVDDGNVVRCERRQQQGPVGEHQVWAFKGSTNLSIVHHESYNEYLYHGWLSKADVVLDEEFFSSYEVEELTLI